ncbi:hypothetical protein [Maricaulis sp.]|uniref:hypothetical protein n=1 Tax=Maricaulis sp. TaxID=1486257 RepID=UPI0025C0BC55|nr:hypothetical protein [Maricaulis sp.]
MKAAAALLRLILCLAGPVAIWFSWRWTGSADSAAAFDGFLETARALAVFGATAFVIASVVALLRLTGNTPLARLARALHACAWLVLYIAMIGPAAHILAPVLAILASSAYDLVRPSDRDGLSDHASPVAAIGRALGLIASGLPLLAAPLGWVGSEIALAVWILLLWLAAAFQLHRFLPRAMTD